MSFKTKIIIGSTILGSIALYSGLHIERYGVIIPCIFAALTILSLITLSFEEEK